MLPLCEFLKDALDCVRICASESCDRISGVGERYRLGWRGHVDVPARVMDGEGTQG